MSNGVIGAVFVVALMGLINFAFLRVVLEQTQKTSSKFGRLVVKAMMWSLPFQMAWVLYKWIEMGASDSH